MAHTYALLAMQSTSLATLSGRAGLAREALRFLGQAADAARHEPSPGCTRRSGCAGRQPRPCWTTSWRCAALSPARGASSTGATIRPTRTGPGSSPRLRSPGTRRWRGSARASRRWPRGCSATCWPTPPCRRATAPTIRRCWRPRCSQSATGPRPSARDCGHCPLSRDRSGRRGPCGASAGPAGGRARQRVRRPPRRRGGAGMNLTFRRYDGEAARAARATVETVYRDAYVEAVASGDPFDGPEPFMRRFDAYTEPGRGFDLVIAFEEGEPVGQSWGWPLRPGASWWDGLDAEPEPGFTDEDGSRTFALSEIIVRRPWTGRGVATRCMTSCCAAGTRSGRPCSWNRATTWPTGPIWRGAGGRWPGCAQGGRMRPCTTCSSCRCRSARCRLTPAYTNALNAPPVSGPAGRSFAVQVSPSTVPWLWLPRCPWPRSRGRRCSCRTG